MNGNIRVGNLFGIPFYVNPSWFLILGLVTLTYGGQLANFPQLNGLTPWILGLIAALLLFSSVVAHELGHSFVAMSQGVGVRSITLFLFGGLASLDKEAETPLQSFLIAIAGPVVSLLLFFVFTLINLNLALSPPLVAIISLLASINLVLGLFNLIPGLPLDGGNILKSIVWQVTGNPNKGVIFASRVGQIFGWIAIVLGGLSVLGLSQIGSFWTLLIGVFLLQNAGISAQSAKFQETLKDYTAKDAIIPNSPVVIGSLTLRQFVNDYVIGQRDWKKFLVTDEEGRLVGTLKVDDLKSVPTSQWNEVFINQLVLVENNLKTVQATQPLVEVIKLLEEEKIPQLTVLADNGNVLGLLEKTSVIQFLQQQLQSKVA
ncbi:MAG: site-2 protease family protein [Microcystaceae cyanobacterium]